MGGWLAKIVVPPCVRWFEMPAVLQRPDPSAAQVAVICSDSEYALDAMLGLSAVKKNGRLVRAVRELWARARERWRRPGGEEGLYARHVRGHSGHQWNSTADWLAARGAEGVVRCEHSNDWSAWLQLRAPPRRAHEVVEAERVLRAAHAFGVLNVPVPTGRLLMPSTVEWLYRVALGRMRVQGGAWRTRGVGRRSLGCGRAERYCYVATSSAVFGTPLCSDRSLAR